MATPRPFADLHALARRHARRADEADDLLQSALLAALEAGRTDLASPDNRRWLAGCIRNQAAMQARTAIRRKRRDDAWSSDVLPSKSEEAATGTDPITHLSPALHVTARLALTGHTRQEIGWLLNLSDTALRQRLSQIKRALANAEAPNTEPALKGMLAFGRIRQALLSASRHGDAFLASHDPDGHLFLIGRSQTGAPRQR